MRGGNASALFSKSLSAVSSPFHATLLAFTSPSDKLFPERVLEEGWEGWSDVESSSHCGRLVLTMVPGTSGPSLTARGRVGGCRDDERGVGKIEWKPSLMALTMARLRDFGGWDAIVNEQAAGPPS